MPATAPGFISLTQIATRPRRLCELVWDASAFGPSAVTVSVQINFGFGASSVNRNGQTEPQCQDLG